MSKSRVMECQSCGGTGSVLNEGGVKAYDYHFTSIDGCKSCGGSGGKYQESKQMMKNNNLTNDFRKGSGKVVISYTNETTRACPNCSSITQDSCNNCAATGHILEGWSKNPKTGWF